MLGALAASGALRLWQMMVIVAVYGGAQAFFDPASDAILPELVPESRLGEANALEQVIRPLALRLVGPALGGSARRRARPGLRVPRGRRHVPRLRGGAVVDVGTRVRVAASHAT